MNYNKVGLNNSSNMIANCMDLFHDFSFSLIIFILCFVVSMCFLTFSSYKNIKFVNSNANIVEFTWTTLPAFFLLSMSFPSFLMLYMLENNNFCSLTTKITSYQWWWAYESSDFSDPDEPMQFNSYMVDAAKINRSITVDSSLFLPFSANNRLIITSMDVLHSWALPSFYFKMDAVPSRLNSFTLNSSYPSSFYSQCSEICGWGHSNMPINVVFTSWDTWFEFY